MRSRRLVVALVAVVAPAVVGGLLVWRLATPPELPRNASPEAVARTYFELDASHRPWAAKGLVWGPDRKYAPDGAGFGGVEMVSVSKAKPQSIAEWNDDGEYDDLADLCRITVDYRAPHASESDTAFVWLGRETPSGPWRLVSQGSPL